MTENNHHETIKSILEKIDRKYQSPEYKKLQKQRSRGDAAYFKKHKSNGCCEICAFHCPAIITVHHIKPVAKGGNGNPENLIYLCPNCHTIIEKLNIGYDLSEWLPQHYTPEIIGKFHDLMYLEVSDDQSNDIRRS